MSISPPEYLKHIRDEARFLATATAGRSEAAFIRDEVLKRACVRAIEIIGEAAKKVPDEFRLRGRLKRSEGMARRVILILGKARAWRQCPEGLGPREQRRSRSKAPPPGGV